GSRRTTRRARRPARNARSRALRRGCDTLPAWECPRAITRPGDAPRLDLSFNKFNFFKAAPLGQSDRSQHVRGCSRAMNGGGLARRGGGGRPLAGLALAVRPPRQSIGRRMSARIVVPRFVGVGTL